MNGESDRGLLRCISSNLPMYLTHCSIGSSTESLKLLLVNIGALGSRHEIDQPKPPGSNPILSYCCDRASKKACAFKFRPIGYFFMIYIDPIFFWLLVFFFLHIPTWFEIARFRGFQLPSTAESVMSHDGPYSKHPKTLR